VVERESACLPSAAEMLPAIDRAINSLRRGGTVLREGEPWPCRECGIGEYRLLFSDETRSLALPKRSTTGQMPNVAALYGRENTTLTVKSYACAACGSLKTFWWPDEKRPDAWRPPRKKPEA